MINIRSTVICASRARHLTIKERRVIFGSDGYLDMGDGEILVHIKTCRMMPLVKVHKLSINTL